MIVNESERWNPRDNFNLGTMIFFHQRYSLGDTHNINASDYVSFIDMQISGLKKKYRVIVPVYMYEHSGIAFSTSPFSCPWDSGQIGFMVVSAEKIRENFNIKRITKKYIDSTLEILNAELIDYSLYINGTPEYSVEDEDGNIVDYFNSKEEAEEYVRANVKV